MLYSNDQENGISMKNMFDYFVHQSLDTVLMKLIDCLFLVHLNAHQPSGFGLLVNLQQVLHFLSLSAQIGLRYQQIGL
jgi:hypothetical protein